ncbi:unnamed protein product [Cochlearia groenlandica]
MRCKRHTVDFSSNLGVCASCLRERLLSLAASAAALSAAEDYHHQSRKHKIPPLLIFPRSVSPYVTRRKSDAAGEPPSNCRRYLATPQVDVGYSCRDFESNGSLKSKRGKFGRFSNLFRSRSEDYDPSPSSSRSWISAIFSGGFPKSKPTITTVDDVIAGRVFCKGMSPARDTELGNELDPTSESIEEESPAILRRTPATKTPGRRKIATGLSGMAFCLSPLVRASPNCPFKRRIRVPSEFVNSGEVIVTEKKPHISEAASFCANRSKKLVDLGRVDRRR